MMGGESGGAEGKDGLREEWRWERGVRGGKEESKWAGMLEGGRSGGGN